MINAFRNLLRHKARAILTIFGIVIGIFAVVVMGGLSERISVMLERADVFISSRIQLQKETNVIGDNTFPQELIDEIEEVPGVRETFPGFLATLENDEGGGIGLGLGLSGGIVMGHPPELVEESFGPIELLKGRWMTEEDKEAKVAIVGADMLDRFGISEVGDKVEIEGAELEVIGILDKTEIVFADAAIVIPIETAWDIYGSEGQILSADAIPEDVGQADEIAERITNEVESIKAISPNRLKENIRRNMLIFRLITLSSAILAAIIGTLAVVNTMIMSVSERTREIGIKKAIGATTGNILGEFLMEATLIGVIGGVFGVLLGWLGIYFLNLYTLQQGVELFLLTPRLALIGFGFAVVLGAVAGIYPALKAARMDPVKALKTD